MKIVLPLAAALLVAATGAVAQTNAAMTKPATPVTKPKAATSATPASATGSSKMATHTTASGKKITYDCSKKGNMNKKACKA